MAEETKKCTVCGNEVKYSTKPDAFACDAYEGAHKLPTKSYYHPGGQDVQNPRERRMFGPHMILRAGRDKMMDDGTRVLVPSIEVFFESGKYSTDNAEQQYYLDQKEKQGQLCDEERWNQIYLTHEQQINLKQAKLEDLEKRIKESNSLLEMAQKGSKRA